MTCSITSTKRSTPSSASATSSTASTGRTSSRASPRPSVCSSAASRPSAAWPRTSPAACRWCARGGVPRPLPGRARPVGGQPRRALLRGADRHRPYADVGIAFANTLKEDTDLVVFTDEYGIARHISTPWIVTMKTKTGLILESTGGLTSALNVLLHCVASRRKGRTQGPPRRLPGAGREPEAVSELRGLVRWMGLGGPRVRGDGGWGRFASLRHLRERGDTQRPRNRGIRGAPSCRVATYLAGTSFSVPWVLAFTSSSLMCIGTYSPLA